MQKNNKLANLLLLIPLSLSQCPGYTGKYKVPDKKTGALFAGIQKGSPNEVRRMLDTTPQDIRIRDKQGHTPLLYAIQQGQWSLALQLIELDKNNRSINMINYLHLSPLHAALLPTTLCPQEDGSSSEQQANVSKEERIVNLQKKLDTRRQELVAALLKKWANVDAVDLGGESPLFKAVTLPSEACVKLLLEKGANPNIITKNGQTVLHPLLKPREKNSPPLELIEMLSKKLNPDTLNHSAGPQKVTALHWAAGWSSQVLEILLHAGADSNIPDALGDRPLHYVVGRFTNATKLTEEQEADICLSIDLLVKSGINIDAPNTVEDTALHIAARGGNEAICTKLLQHGAKACLQNQGGDTALHIAERSGNKAIYQKLLQYCDDNPPSNTKKRRFTPNQQSPPHSLVYESGVKRRRLKS